ncbi:hypothetical protein BDP55DRAFT_15726 [Colletotrichum godetiae]|uniref:Uncharacterized protein n=1 Tax=Colletotrichum godetiae TaxID=1209918 RepID=A0AAJ0B1C2_9PEZI|nr:uncharacterized protein BDP55DRAFT_15726 [Colletotrichum godetiae]KAK1701272.1 hypothetical protein BDP55DRAFT_15726 [Colletotrichum godetiae]
MLLAGPWSKVTCCSVSLPSPPRLLPPTPPPPPPPPPSLPLGTGVSSSTSSSSSSSSSYCCLGIVHCPPRPIRHSTLSPLAMAGLSLEPTDTPPNLTLRQTPFSAPTSTPLRSLTFGPVCTMRPHPRPSYSTLANHFSISSHFDSGAFLPSKHCIQAPSSASTYNPSVVALVSIHPPARFCCFDTHNAECDDCASPVHLIAVPTSSLHVRHPM